MANPLRNSEGVGAGFATNDMNTSAILEARSTTKGFLPPRGTFANMNAIVSPGNGLEFTVNSGVSQGKYYYNGSAWVSFSGSSTPTLQQVTGAGNQTTDEIIISSAGNITTIYPNELSLISADGNTADITSGDGFAVQNIDGSYGQLNSGILFLLNTASNGFQLKADNITSPLKILQAPNQSGTPLMSINNVQADDDTGNITLAIPTTATDLDALKRDGSNANATLDLQAVAQGVTGTFVRGNTVEIEGANPTKKSIISGNFLTDVRDMEMPDYAGTMTTEGYVNSNIKTPIAGTGISIDNTDPQNPIINATGGVGTVTDVSIVTANGVTGSVANSTTTPAITLSLGAITPTTVVASGAVSGSNLSGTNTGDQTNISGTAAMATALQIARTIGTITGDATSAGSAFNGTANNTNALTLATVNSNVGSFTNASVTVNAKGLVTAVSSGTAPVTSVTGTANRITVTGTTTPTLDIGTDVVTLTGTQTVTNKSLTSPTLTGLTTVTGTTQTGSSAIGVIDITQTLNTTGSPTIIKSNITNTASGSTTKLIDLQVGAVTQFNVTKAGLGYFAGGLSLPSFSAITGVNGNSIAFGSNGLTYTTGTSTTPTGIGHSFAQGNLNNITSGNYNFIQAAQSFTPTSGTGTFSTLVLSSTVNQTGGANGITRGIYINPTITAAADFRAFELTNNTGYALYGSGTAPNYLAGKLGLGQTTATAVLHLKAGTATANTAPLKLTSGTNLTTTEAGAVEFDGAHFYGTATNGGSRYQLDNQVLANSYSGVGTATTTFTVSIGSTMANSTYKVTVTPTSSLSAALFYVTNKTTTTFDVMYLAGLTGTVTFDWHLVP